MSVLGEIKRRKVFQVAVVYAVVAWLLVQIVDIVNDPLNLPAWFDTVAIVSLMLGFPIAMVVAWAFDITPAGVVRTPASDTVAETGVSVSATHQPIQSPEQASPSPPGGSGERRSELLRNSVAVLPLENLSPNPDDAYFAAGIHEEILNYLTKIKDLSVIARTSVKKYMDTDKSISEIAGELGVGTVMEGSVRYAGERVRVTAQLIDAATENHLWSEVYERDLADVFAIQADIAAKIADGLEAEFSAAERESIEALPTTGSSEAHALFLKSQALFGQGDTALLGTTPASVRANIQSKLDQAIGLDPEFAHPYAMKALLYAVSKTYDPIKEKDWLKRCAELDEYVRLNAEKALALNANLGLPHFALALHHQINWRGEHAREAYERALELRPNDSNVLTWYSVLKWSSEAFGDAVRLAEKALALDPGGNPLVYVNLGIYLHASGDHSASANILEKASKAHPGSAFPYLLRTLPELALGNEARARQGMRLADQLMPDDSAPTIRAHVAYGYGMLGQREDAKRVWNRTEEMIGDRFVDPIVRVWGCLALGESDQALQWLHKAENPEYRQEIWLRTFMKQNTWADPILDQPEFVEARSRLGFGE